MSILDTIASWMTQPVEGAAWYDLALFAILPPVILFFLVIGVHAFVISRRRATKGREAHTYGPVEFSGGHLNKDVLEASGVLTPGPGVKNRAIGSKAAFVVSNGTNNIVIGWKTSEVVPTGSNNFAIGDSVPVDEYDGDPKGL